jgi:hypothetical protein
MSSLNAEATSVIVLVRDLMFAGRVGATARAEGVAVKMLRDPAGLADADGARLVVDLDLAGALAAAVEWKKRTAGQVIAFVAHTNADAIRTAQHAGLDKVLARGAFVELLPRLLRGED